jgi:predicted ATP-binding protein involved in virulence
MYLKKVEIKRLFCKFNYEIPVNNKDRITILYGLNGHGKTTILRMINAFYRKDFFEIAKIPFSSFSIEFDNKNAVTIYKNFLFVAEKYLNDDKNRNILGYIDKNKNNKLFFEIFDSKKTEITFFLYDGLKFEKIAFTQEMRNINEISKQKEKIIELLENKDEITHICQEGINFEESKLEDAIKLYYLSAFESINKSENIFDENKKENTELLKLYLKFNEHKNEERDWFSLPNRKQKKEGKTVSIIDIQIPDILEQIFQESNVELIESQRLLQYGFLEKAESKKTIEKVKLTVTYCSDGIKEEIVKKNAEYASIAQKLDKSFPDRLLKMIREKQFENSNIKAISNNLETLYKIQENLIKLGIFSEDIEPDRIRLDPQIDKDDMTLSNFFQLYIKDTTEKIQVFSELSNRLQNFVNIIDPLFEDKRLKFSNTEGMIFTDIDTGVIIKPEMLSSGEQHVIVLFFDLLFKFKSNSLILIDEPEISLHIRWQNNFVKILQSISKLNNMNFILSTHSPNIVYDRDDLAFEIS